MPTPTEVPLVQVGTVNTGSAINVRGGAGTSFGVVTALNVDVQARIIGESVAVDGELWYQIRLPDGTEGWVAGFLLDLDEVPENTLETAPEGDARLAPTYRTYSRVTMLTRAQADAPETNADNNATFSTEDHEQRYQAMTLGIIAAVALIFLANFYYILRVVVRRGRKD
jgi:uncharacterized protein YgiM (DUF1202 family)